MKKILIVVILALFSNLINYAQDRMVQGVVNTLDSIPLIGVEITIQSTKQVIRTDSLGNFLAACDNKDKLKLKATGFYNQNVKIDENVKIVAINMKLKPGEKQLDYAIGYGYISEKDRTTAVSTHGMKKTDYSKYNNVFEIITGMGGQIQNGEIVLRGAKSFQGSSGALIVVDGSPVDYNYLSTLRPIDIKRVDIMRDGASSVYGTRGANGVVQIETLKGK